MLQKREFISYFSRFDIFCFFFLSQFDNRRRMGVELCVLSLLCGRRSSAFAVPDKYHSPTFVLEMLVSCK